MIRRGGKHTSDGRSEGTPPRLRGKAARSERIDIDQSVINIPTVASEIASEFDAYEKALITNDVEALNAFFWNSEEAVRFGVHENLYGAQAIAHYRRGVPDGQWLRTLMNTFIVTFGDDAASVTTEYVQSNGTTGRQSQMWARLPEGWRIVATHVSVIPTADTA